MCIFFVTSISSDRFHLLLTLGLDATDISVGELATLHTHTHTHTHTYKTCTEGPSAMLRETAEPPLVMKGNQATAWIVTDSSQRTWLPGSLRTTMHLSTSRISVETMPPENYNSAWKQKKEKELFIVRLDRQKQTIKTSGNFRYDFSQCYMLVSVKKWGCFVCIDTFLIVEMFYSFERCFTLFGLPLYSFPSVGVNRSVYGSM